MKVNVYMQRLAYLFGVILVCILIVSGNIRRHKENFYLAFDRVHENTRMLQAYVIKTFPNLDVYDCIVECIKIPDCEAINLHQYSGACETLSSSTLVTKDLLERKAGWSFYETDPAKQDIGHYCEEASPCPDTHICEDTYITDNSYTCGCEEHYEGIICMDYNGPGVNDSVPAGSCKLLKDKHKKITNGFYWLQSANGSVSKQFCEMSEGIGVGLGLTTAVPSCDWLLRNYPRLPSREYWVFNSDQRNAEKEKCLMLWDKVHGGWGKWSMYDTCTEECNTGTKTRKRTCDNPAPIHGGKHCRDDQETEENEKKECNVQRCCDGSILPSTDLEGINLGFHKSDSWTACFYYCKRFKENQGFVWLNKNYKPVKYAFKCHCKGITVEKSLSPPTTVISGYDVAKLCGAVITNDGKTLTLKCNEGEELVIEWASYGPRYVIAKCSVTKTDFVTTECGGKQNCTIAVSHVYVNGGTDNCPGKPKYLAVQYKCN